MALGLRSSGKSRRLVRVQEGGDELLYFSVVAAPMPVGVEKQTRPGVWVLSIRGARDAEEHYGFMHNVEMCVQGGEVAWVGFRVGYDIPKNVRMTTAPAQGEAWRFSF